MWNNTSFSIRFLMNFHITIAEFDRIHRMGARKDVDKYEFYRILVSKVSSKTCYAS